ncbi:MAG: hypothetical protein WCJ95_12825 [Mariniphaga sp.]
MKKLSIKYKKFLNRRNKTEISKKRNRKTKKYNNNIVQNKSIPPRGTTFEDEYAPRDLMLQYESVEKVLKYISIIKNKGIQGKNLSIRLENVNNIGEGAIAMLLSVINELSQSGILIKGTKPLNQKAKSILEKSGFFKHIRGSIDSENMNSKNIIIRTGDNNTSQQELAPEIIKAMETVWGEKARCPLLFGGIGEMLRNSCDHAFNNKENITWHIGLSHIEEENTVKFSFVDNGEGIITRYNQKGLITKVISYFKNDAEILENAFKSGIESRTGLPWRGLGLPTIFELYTDKIITNLVVITNHVFLDFDKNIAEKLQNGFSGTYYFWKINKSCAKSYFQLSKN